MTPLHYFECDLKMVALSRMNKNGDYANLEHLSVKEVLSENPIDKIVTLLATDKDENKVRNPDE